MIQEKMWCGKLLDMRPYCSRLSKSDIINMYQDFLSKSYVNKAKLQEVAIKRIEEFTNKDYDELDLNKDLSQRIILISAKFRKEVTSTVLWAT